MTAVADPRRKRRHRRAGHGDHIGAWAAMTASGRGEAPAGSRFRGGCFVELVPTPALSGGDGQGYRWGWAGSSFAVALTPQGVAPGRGDPRPPVITQRDRPARAM